MSWGKNDLAICELINPHIHGTDIDNCGHYLVTWYIDWKKLNIHSDIIYSLADEFRHSTTAMLGNAGLLTNEVHPFIRAYSDILQKKGFHTLEIVEGIELDSGEYIAILKTFWLRIFQRKWRNICRERAEAWKKAKFLCYREINGRFPLINFS